MKNKILKALAYINGLLLVLSMCAESEEYWYVPLIVMAISGSWLFLFAYANGYLEINTTQEEAEYEDHQAESTVHHTDESHERTYRYEAG